MSVIISVYCNEGIVLASESRATHIFPGKRLIPFSDNAHKTFGTPNGYGISTCGAATVNGQPISGCIEKFINTYNYTDTTVERFAKELASFFKNAIYKGQITFHVGGYDRNDDGSITERLFRLIIGSGMPDALNEITQPGGSGAMWDGETATLSKLIKGQLLTSDPIEAVDVRYRLAPNGEEQTLEHAFIVPKENAVRYQEATIEWRLFSLQDAIDFARFGIRTTIDAQHFLSTEKTVGGPIDVLVVRPTGCQWVSKKELV